MKINGPLVTATVVVAAILRSAVAAEPARVETASADKAQSIEMFQAIDEGQIEVNFYPMNATEARVIIKSKTDQPVNVALPKAFGAIHVLGQMGMGGGYGGGGGGGMGGMGGGMGGGGGGQGLGGGMGGGGMGGGGMGGGGYGGGGGMGGGGMFRVEPEKTHRLKVPCVCLEHGKPDPNPRMKYKIVPIELVNADPRVIKVCELLGQGKLPQNTAQAAAWHLANGLSWNQLAAKNRKESRYTGIEKFFNPVELRNAFQLSTLITRHYETEEEGDDSSGYSEYADVSEAAGE